MNIDIKKLFPMSFIASFGAPVVYLLIIMIQQDTDTNSSIDLEVLVIVFCSSLFFSFLGTLGIILGVMLFCKLFDIRKVNIVFLTTLFFLLVVVPVIIVHGLNSGIIVTALFMANFVVFIIMHWLILKQGRLG